MAEPDPTDRSPDYRRLDRRGFIARAAMAAGGLALGRGRLAGDVGIHSGAGLAGGRLAVGLGGPGGPRGHGFVPLARPVPSPSQLAWQRDELALFIHFGINTFTGREWGDGTGDPAGFNPSALDTRQWAHVASEAGFRAMVLTAKHHDGFCLWPTETTDHSVASSPWQGGRGDVVRDFVVACRTEGLRVGLYCSPWDRNHPTYGDSPRYNDVYIGQLTELLTRYGPIHEVWFDGANGEGPNGKRQAYDWPRFWGRVRALRPNAVIFSDAGPDVRWIGNENGVAGDPNWSTVNPATVPVPGLSGPDVMRQLRHGDHDGTVELGRAVDVGILDLGEDIAHGQLVERWTVEGRVAGGRTAAGWETLAGGETIGYRKLDRFPATRIDAVRLTLRTLDRPRPVRVGLYAPAG